MSRAVAGFAAVFLASLVAMAAIPLWTHGAIAAAAHVAFAGLCHQDAARSFVVDGAQMAICHRCTGIYAGLALGALATALGARAQPRSVLGWTIAAIALGGHVVLGWIAPSIFDLAGLRVASGLVFGAWSGAALASALGGLRVRATAKEA